MILESDDLHPFLFLILERRFNAQPYHFYTVFVNNIFNNLYYSDPNHPQGITSDGTFGSTVSFDLKTYNIKGGTAKNDNLFHSFEKFNLHSGETAIFHDSGFQNTISRVTGQDYSWINGKIQSGAANLYLLNPNGVMFGPEVSLALPGSFHVSTADYLKFGDKVDYFYVNQRKDSVLSVESPSAFGFLDDSIGSIRVEGQGSMPGPIIGPPIIDPPIIGPPIIVPPITGSPNIDDNIGDPIPGPGPGPIPGPDPGPGPIQGATISGLNVSHGKTIIKMQIL